MSSVHFTQTVAYNYTHTQSILLKQCRHYDDFSFFKEKDRNFISLVKFWIAMYSLAIEVFCRTNSSGTQYKRHTVLKFILTNFFFFFNLGEVVLGVWDSSSCE